MSPEPIRHGVVIAGVNLLIPYGTRSELAPMQLGCRLPSAPPWFNGFINHRGEVAPVYNLSVLLNRDNPLVNPKWVLLLDTMPNTIGILTDEYPTSLSDLEPLTAGVTDSHPLLLPFINQVYRQERQAWLELNHRGFFASLAEQFTSS